ncbi:methionyl-tRNA formyltransferase [Candidatus Magnetomorum sp. HK-1]|nr:methionyl-tRNA formyltransferase [Candidatus Magnetomorum sp. HK-1]
MKVILLLNWGIGYEILKVFHKLSDIVIEMVVTRYNANDNISDKWENIVYNYSKENEYRTIDQKNISFDMLKQIIDNNKIDLLVSHSYMKIFPIHIFQAPRVGSINIHASLLPKYRGASPTYWVLTNKETKTGLTCHFIDEGVDSGDIISQKEIDVQTDDTIETIIEKQKLIVKDLIIESLFNLKNPNFCAIKQDEKKAIYAPRP